MSSKWCLKDYNIYESNVSKMSSKSIKKAIARLTFEEEHHTEDFD